MLFAMLTRNMYEIGKKYNLVTKYNINYDRRPLLDYACAVHVSQLLEQKYVLTDEQRNKLEVLLDNLIVL